MTTTLTAAPPRFRHVPLHASTAAQDAIDLGEAAGLTLDEWQQQDLRDAMARTVHDRWAATEVGLVVPRQNGKGSILEVRQLWGLFLSKHSVLQTHTAHRFDTCLDHFRRVVSLIEGTPELLALVKDNGRGVGDRPSGIKDSNGKESIELINGRRLNFKARSKGSGRGFSGDDVYFDEAFWLDDLGSLIPSLSARQDPQIWYTSSAPLRRVESDRLRKVVRRGRVLAANPDPSSKLCYLEHSADQKFADDLDNPEALEQANPATSVGRITAEFAAVEREAMSDEEYARERLGIFPDTDDEPQWLVVTEAQYLACEPKLADGTPLPADAAGWLQAPIAVAVELTQDRETITVVAAGQTSDGAGAQVLMREPNCPPTLDAIANLVSADPQITTVVVDAGSQAGSLVPDLETLGLTVVECTTKELVKATGSALDAIRTVDIRLRRSPELDASVASAVVKKRGDTELIDRWAAGDPTPFIGVVLARWGMAQKPDDDGPSVYEERGLVTL